LKEMSGSKPSQSMEQWKTTASPLTRAGQTE
jgi:hypothetical protein